MGMRASWVSRVLLWLVMALVGALYGFAGTLVHGSIAVLGAVTVPVGIVVALAGTASLLVAVRLLADGRPAAFACALGMMAVTLVLSGTGPGGSAVMPSSTLATVWTLAQPVLAAVVLAWPGRGRAASANGAATEN